MSAEPPTALALDTLERLLGLPASDMAAVRADKVDAFLYDEQKASLVAIGSITPLDLVAARRS
jgi:hypothetical protein